MPGGGGAVSQWPPAPPGLEAVSPLGSHPLLCDCSVLSHSPCLLGLGLGWWVQGERVCSMQTAPLKFYVDSKIQC